MCVNVHFCDAFALILTPLEHSGALLGRFLGASWPPLGRSRAPSDRPWAPLGCILALYEASGLDFDRFWSDFQPFWDRFFIDFSSLLSLVFRSAFGAFLGMVQEWLH